MRGGSSISPSTCGSVTEKRPGEAASGSSRPGSSSSVSRDSNGLGGAKSLHKRFDVGGTHRLVSVSLLLTLANPTRNDIRNGL